MDLDIVASLHWKQHKELWLVLSPYPTQPLSLMFPRLHIMWPRIETLLLIGN